MGHPTLAGCEVYASGQLCPMCMAAMRMVGITRVRNAHSNEDAEPFGLSTAAIYADMAKPFAEQSMDIRHVKTTEVPETYVIWQNASASKKP